MACWVHELARGFLWDDTDHIYIPLAGKSPEQGVRTATNEMQMGSRIVDSIKRTSEVPMADASPIGISVINRRSMGRRQHIPVSCVVPSKGW